MDRKLFRLVYVSRSRVNVPSALSQVIDDILETSRQNNGAAGITGALMFNAACFGQVLEGSRPALAATFERIQRDSRHGDVTLLAFDPIDTRSFAEWSMGFVGAKPDDAARFSEVGLSSGFDPSMATGDALLASLRDLALADESRRG